MEKETFVDIHLAYICSRNDITVPVLLSCEPDATLPLGSGGSVHACCVTVQATANASTDGFDMLSCSPEDASGLFQLEKSYNSCSKSIESEDAESRYDFYSTYCDFDYQNVFNSSSDKKEPQNLHSRLSKWTLDSHLLCYKFAFMKIT